METDLAKNLIRQLYEAGYRNSLYFHLLGEPLLHPDMVEILEFASRLNPRTVLFTNGSLLTEKTIESVFNACPHELMISMQLADERTFGLRGSSMIWSQYVSRIAETVQYKLTHSTPTLLRISVGVRKEDSLFPQDDYFPRVPTPDLRSNIVKLFSEVPAVDTDQMKESLDSVQIPFAERLDVGPGVSVSTKQMGNWRRLYSDKRVEKGFCQHFAKEFGILSNGRLVYCHLDYDGRTTFGDARIEKLQTIFRRTELLGETERFLEEGIVARGCQHCVIPSRQKRKRE